VKPTWSLVDIKPVGFGKVPRIAAADFRELRTVRVFNISETASISVFAGWLAGKRNASGGSRGVIMTARKIWMIVGIAATLLAAVSAQATSHVRIVRLSYVDGKVQLERAPGQGLERAILNSPIVEGERIVTGVNGLAEVEFENDNVVRLGEATEIAIRQLLINDAGNKVNEVELLRGTMYFDTKSGKGDICRVIAVGKTFVLRHDSQVRFMMGGDQVQAAVLSGEVQFDDNAQLVRLKKNNTITVDPASTPGYVVAKGFDSSPLDRWNSERAAYLSAYAYSNSGYGSKGMSGSGYADLAYYGGFNSLPGYGLVWIPYGASNWMGWSPYDSGGWVFTGFGYVWASAYPWGWLPYHYGAWGYQNGIGWFWAPGSSFSGGGVVTNWKPTTPVTNGPPGYTAPLPPTMPGNGPRPSVLVGQIGRTPAYIPGGPVPPNFRSVITDHSGITGMTAPSSGGSGGGGSASAARNSRAVNMTGADRSTARNNSFVAPGQGTSKPQFGQNNSGRASNPGGHVFVAPSQPSFNSDGFAVRTSPGMGGGGYPGQQSSGAPMRSSGSGMGNSGGMGHAASSGGAAHSTPVSNPK
jgi:hypothetical protein